MKKENRRNILLRYGAIVFAILLLSIRIVYKLVDNTVLSAPQWNALAEKELSRIDTIEPERGEILAADGSVLATNMILYTPCLDLRHPKFNEDSYRAAIPEVADSLALHFPARNAKQWRKYLLSPLKRDADRRSRAFAIVRDISFFESEMVKSFPFPRLKSKTPGKKGQLIGFKVESRPVRVRPYGAMARRSIGAVGVTDSIKRVHGKYGLEKALDSLLYGRPGYTKRVPLTSAIVQWNDIPPVNGYSVHTTIDIKMQDIVENELNKMLEFCDADWGTAVLMEVATGDIKAVANLEQNPGEGERYIESRNRAVLGYEPGSVVKTLSMLIALEDGIVTNVNEVIELGHEWYYYGRKPIKDSHYNASLPVSEILEQSSNIGMAKIITRRYGPKPSSYHDRVKQLGFLDPMNSGIAGEAVPKFTKLENNDLGRQMLSRQSYGYCTEISPLYTASLYNAIANDGVYVRPRLVRGLTGNGIDTVFPVTNMRDRICSVNNARTLRKMLSAVVWGKHGTARHHLQSPLVRIIGKTGTANINREKIGYTHGVNRLAFCGIFPEEKPRFTCMVIISYPKRNAMGAASNAGTVVRKVAEALYSRGMLDYDDSYTKGDRNDTPVPTLHASLDPERNTRVQRALNLGNRKAVMATPRTYAKGLPSVLGLGIRDAIKVLESKGYQVSIKGHGCVTGQVPAPGTQVKKGARIYLTLKE